MIVHIFTDTGLRERLKDEVQKLYDESTGSNQGIRYSSKAPLLSSVLAETLRLHANSLLAFSPTSSDVMLGEWVFPSGKLGVLDTRLLHMDESFWNTKNGLHPLSKFWAERFIVDPSDAASGPVRFECRKGQQGKPRSNLEKPDKLAYSVEGLEGAWLPYGGRPF